MKRLALEGTLRLLQDHCKQRQEWHILPFPFLCFLLGLSYSIATTTHAQPRSHQQGVQTWHKSWECHPILTQQTGCQDSILERHKSSRCLLSKSDTCLGSSKSKKGQKTKRGPLLRALQGSTGLALTEWGHWRGTLGYESSL